MVMKVGDNAKDFSLPNQDLKMVKLSDFFGNKIILAFFPGAFTSVCTKEMCTFRDSMAKFNKFNAKVIGISIDPPFSLNAFAKYNNLNFDLLSDFNKEVSKEYAGLHNDFAGIKGLQASKRGVFIIGKDKKIKYAWVSEDPGKEPNYSEIEENLGKE
ncbi:MAG: peroxiredoxin [Thermoplasmata archaeon]|nr:peroxiredoxin [Thermoplasmata archaeon]